MACKQQRKITIHRKVSTEPMSVQDWQSAERILAKLVAQAYAADHPHLFGLPSKNVDSGEAVDS